MRCESKAGSQQRLLGELPDAETRIRSSGEKSTLVAWLEWAAIVVGSFIASCMTVNAEKRARTEAEVTGRLYHRVPEMRNVEGP